MTLKSYLLIMVGSSSLCTAALLFIFNFVNPDKTNWLGFLLCYLAIFLSASGWSAVIGFFVRFLIMRQKLLFRAVREAFRQAFLLAILVSSTLFLLARDLFSWLNVALLILAIALLELFLSSLQPRRPEEVSEINMEG
ncbi:MAG: hypothetical protein MUF50_00445 [Planctomycetes bacterium]|jgi:hypothetical protein|nr:hypothetical protein [Planctomycetota bacterium]